jgi:hypothetical protein
MIALAAVGYQASSCKTLILMEALNAWTFLVVWFFSQGLASAKSKCNDLTNEYSLTGGERLP